MFYTYRNTGAFIHEVMHNGQDVDKRQELSETNKWNEINQQEAFCTFGYSKPCHKYHVYYCFQP